MRKRHAVRTEKILEVDGKMIGSGVTIHYEDGPPIFGICEWDECDKQATQETAIGRQFCEEHFTEFYTS